MREISDYANWLITFKGAADLTVQQAVRHIIEFWEFLPSNDVRLTVLSDRLLREFRDQNLKKVMRSKAHRGGEEQAKATVNLKLRRVYDWILWLQEMRVVPVGTIGPQGRVTAAIEMRKTHVSGSRNRFASGAKKYPLLFKVALRNAKHNAPSSVVTSETMNNLVEFFVRRYEPFLAQRNILFADIADAAGFRRGSICSLRVDQFETHDIQQAKGEYLVRPQRQKFGYTKTFGIDLALAIRVRDFIDNYWLPWIAEHRVHRSVHQNRLFLSAKTGRPVKERSMTQIVSGAFRELGFDKGVGPHTLRGKFASDQADEELAQRRDLGLDTSNRSIAAALAMKLGHNDPDQFYRYASSSQARQARIAREGRRAELEALREENALLREQLNSLKKSKKP